MEESWDFEFLSRMVDSLVSFLSEFVDDWLANDMRVAVFKILFSWLVISLVAIHFAWKVYGNTVNDMYYRQGEYLLRCSAKSINPTVCNAIIYINNIAPFIK